MLRATDRAIRFRLWSVLCLGCLPWGTACSHPRFEGAQVQEPPHNFLFDANADKGRNVYPDREERRQTAWMRGFGDGGHSSLFITTYSGSSSRADVQAARDSQEERYGRSIRYGQLESFEIDGRPAWGWLEKQVAKGDTVSVEYKAVVSYDSVSYAIEFFSSEPEWMDGWRQRQVIETFAIGKTRPNYLLILLLIAFVSVSLWLIRKWGAERRPEPEGSRLILETASHHAGNGEAQDAGSDPGVPDEGGSGTAGEGVEESTRAE